MLSFNRLRTKGEYLNTYIEDKNETIGWQIRRITGKIVEKNGYSLLLNKNKNKPPIIWVKRK